jgi:hypothetical protein
LKKSIPIFLFSIVLSILLIDSRAYSDDGQNVDELKKSAPKVFIDCEHCDLDFIRTEITFVNYVWDRKKADVHVLITQQPTGSGGSEYTLAFIGQNNFQDLKNELKYYSNKIETEYETRKGLVQVLKLGLASYAARTPMASILSLSIDREVKSTAVEDKWNFWVFSISLSSYLNGEKSRKENSIDGNLSANRITPESKLRLGLTANFDESKFEYEGETIKSSTESRAFDGLYVKSLGEHWSIGGLINVSSSTYRNINYGFSIHPAVEYNFFPYSQSTRRQLRVLYKIGYNYAKYLEETIYDKYKESTLNEALSVTLEVIEPWGNALLSVEGSHYFHDFSKRRLQLSAELSFRIFEGLSLTLDGIYSALRDQLSLRKSQASLEEVLLQRTELASNYDYFVMIGLSYSFGSIFSNVVNPRFGNGLGGGESDEYHD